MTKSCNLAVLVIPGPELTTVPDEQNLEYVPRLHREKITVLVLCRGAVCARAGIYRQSTYDRTKAVF